MTRGGWAGPTRRPAITISFMGTSIKLSDRFVEAIRSMIRPPEGGEILQDFSYACRDHLVCRGRVVAVPRDEELVAVDAVFRRQTRQNVNHCDSMRLRDSLDALVVGAPEMMPRHLVAAR